MTGLLIKIEYLSIVGAKWHLESYPNNGKLWGIGAVGSALEWHSRGHQFEPGMLHYDKTLMNWAFIRVFSFQFCFDFEVNV